MRISYRPPVLFGSKPLDYGPAIALQQRLSQAGFAPRLLADGRKEEQVTLGLVRFEGTDVLEPFLSIPVPPGNNLISEAGQKANVIRKIQRENTPGNPAQSLAWVTADSAPAAAEISEAQLATRAGFVAGSSRMPATLHFVKFQNKTVPVLLKTPTVTAGWTYPKGQEARKPPTRQSGVIGVLPLTGHRR